MRRLLLGIGLLVAFCNIYAENVYITLTNSSSTPYFISIQKLEEGTNIHGPNGKNTPFILDANSSVCLSNSEETHTMYTALSISLTPNSPVENSIITQLAYQYGQPLAISWSNKNKPVFGISFKATTQGCEL